MNIDGTASALANARTSVSAAFARATSRMKVTYDSTGSPLTQSDVKMLRATSGLNFSWPPKAGELVPEAQAAVSDYRQKQINEGEDIADFTSDDVKKMMASGMLSDALGHGLQSYLNGDQSSVTAALAPVATSTSPTSDALTAASPTASSATDAGQAGLLARPSSGSRAADGSLYL